MHIYSMIKLKQLQVVLWIAGQRVGGLRFGPTGGYLDMVETSLEDVNSGPYSHPRCNNDHEFDDKGIGLYTELIIWHVWVQRVR